MAILAAVYTLLLWYTYAYMIAPVFSYAGYSYRAVAPPVAFLLVMAAIMPVAWMPLAVTKPSQLVQWYLYIFVFVPIVLIPAISLARPIADTLGLIAVVLASFGLLSITPSLPPIRLPRIRLSSWAFWSCIGIVAGALYLYVIRVFGVSNHLPSLFAVYDTRSAYRAQLAEAGGTVAYAVLWLGNLFNPLFLAFGLVNHRFTLLAIGMAGQLLLYTITGFKSVLFTIVLLVALLLALRRSGRAFGMWILAGSTSVVAAAIAFDVMRGGVLLTGLFVRRLMLVPGLLTGMYYDFFSQNPPALLGNSFLRGLAPYPYPVGPANIIGSRFLGNIEGHANANLWADGYANFRMPGILGVTLVLVLILWMFDSLAHQRRSRETILIVAIPAFALCNSSLQTVFVTHGLALALLVASLLPSDAAKTENAGAFEPGA